MARALHEGTALLPSVQVNAKETFDVGCDSISCLEMGLWFGLRAMLEGVLEDITKRYEQDFFIKYLRNFQTAKERGVSGMLMMFGQPIAWAAESGYSEGFSRRISGNAGPNPARGGCIKRPAAPPG